MPPLTVNVPGIVAPELSLEVESFLTCPLSQDLFNDPVVLVESGQTFNRHMLLRWLAQHDTCPVTRQVLVSKAVVPNHAIRSLMDGFYRMGLISQPADPPPTPGAVPPAPGDLKLDCSGAESEPAGGTLYVGRHWLADGAAFDLPRFVERLAMLPQGAADLAVPASDACAEPAADRATVCGLSLREIAVPQAGYAAWRSTSVGSITVPQDFNPQRNRVHVAFSGDFDPSYIDRSYGHVYVGDIELYTPGTHIERRAAGSITKNNVAWAPGSTQEIRVSQYVGGWFSITITLAMTYRALPAAATGDGTAPAPTGPPSPTTPVATDDAPAAIAGH